MVKTRQRGKGLGAKQNCHRANEKRGIDYRARLYAVEDQELALAELGTHIKRHFSDVYALSSRRFEELVDDVFRNYGFRTILTTASRDDGVDVFLLDQNGNATTIVEVKRYPEQRKVGLEIVDMLIYTASRAGAVAALKRGSFCHAGEQWMLHFEEKGGKSRQIPVRHDLEQMIFAYR